MIKSYSEILEAYTANGAESLKPSIPDLVASLLCDKSASSNFRYLCSDICMDLKQFDAAIALLKTQEEIGDLSDIGYNNLGYCYWECDEHELAYRAFDRSLELNPGNLSSLRGAAYCSIETPRTVQAVEICRSFYEESGGTPEAALWYVTSLFNARDIATMSRILNERKEMHGIEPILSGFRCNDNDGPG